MNEEWAQTSRSITSQTIKSSDALWGSHYIHSFEHRFWGQKNAVNPARTHPCDSLAGWRPFPLHNAMATRSSQTAIHSIFTQCSKQILAINKPHSGCPQWSSDSYKLCLPVLVKYNLHAIWYNGMPDSGLYCKVWLVTDTDYSHQWRPRMCRPKP